jgi:pyridoxal phosphate enzyme (YggS family)
VEKQAQLPSDIRWHFIGHLQSNKVKYIAPFVYLIHGIDSLKLLKEVDKQAQKTKRVIDVLLQVHIASEETKFGLDEEELGNLLVSAQINQLKNVRIRGLMGMASFTSDKDTVRKEFNSLKQLFDKYAVMVNGIETEPYTKETFTILSMGMSGDFDLAIEEGSTMVRIGSLIFGERESTPTL